MHLIPGAGGEKLLINLYKVTAVEANYSNPYSSWLYLEGNSHGFGCDLPPHEVLDLLKEHFNVVEENFRNLP
jgi:hypothetical protein